MAGDNVFAFTAPGIYYPEFVSVNAVEDSIEFIVRSPANPISATCGSTAMARIPRAQARELAEKLMKL